MNFRDRIVGNETRYYYKIIKSILAKEMDSYLSLPKGYKECKKTETFGSFGKK